MSLEDQTTPTSRAVALFQRGPAGAAAPRRRGLRGALRGGLLRVMRPYTYYQRELDAELVGALERVQAELEQVRERHAEQIARLEHFVYELIITAESLRRMSVRAANSGAQATRAIDALTDELQALPYVAGSPFESFRGPVGEVVGFRSGAAGSSQGRAAGESEYVAFEELFRGPAERVLASQRVYLDLIRGHEPVLDVGCGRGEFLALLAGDGIHAIGVDSDAGMIRRSRALGLEVVHSSGNDYLAGVADHSLGTIFSAQVIEHMPYLELTQMLALALRKLRPGGMLIAETVNPHRIASLKTFWVDLTHQHPIFPEVALAMCAIAGFTQAYVFAPGFRSFERARFAASAYAVVATSS